MPDSYRKFGPMPAIVQPVRRPPTAPAMNGHMAFKAALSIPAQSISSFMLLFPFLVLVGYGVVLRALPFAGRTCRTRVTRGTFDFQEEDAGELRA